MIKKINLILDNEEFNKTLANFINKFSICKLMILRKNNKTKTYINSDRFLIK